MPRDEGQEVVDRAPSTRVELPARAHPRVGGEATQQRERFGAAPRERAQGVVSVVTQVLALVGPAVRVGRRETRLVAGEDRGEPVVERFLEIAQVTDDFDGRPRVARDEAARLRPDVQIVDRLSVRRVVAA